MKQYKWHYLQHEKQVLIKKLLFKLCSNVAWIKLSVVHVDHLHVKRNPNCEGFNLLMWRSGVTKGHVTQTPALDTWGYVAACMRGVNRQMDQQILEIFLPGFRIQSKVLMDFCILQLQRIADSSIFGPRFWTVCVIKVILPRFQIQTKF